MFQRFRFGRLAGIVFLALLSAAAAFSQERADCHAFPSAILHLSVRYCVFLPASYSSEARRPSCTRSCIFCTALAATSNRWRCTENGRPCRICAASRKWAISWWSLRTDGTRSTSIRGTARRLYGDFFLREFMPFIERTYRVRAGSASRGITGFSMGGYGALRTAFGHPELFGSVSAHSAALMRDPPQGVNAGASSGNLAAELLTNVFGNPID